MAKRVQPKRPINVPPRGQTARMPLARMKHQPAGGTTEVFTKKGNK